MTERYDRRRLRDDPRLFWMLLIVGAACFAGLFVLRAVLPGDVAEQEARSAQIEAQATTAEAAQAGADVAETKRRAEIMD
jgi:hypothetical protein